MTIKLSTLVKALAPEFPNARLVGDPELLIHALSPLETAQDGSLCFLSHPKYAQKLASSNATCVVVGAADETAAVQRGATIVVADPYYYFARLTQVWKRHHGTVSVATIHPTACIDASARVDSGVSIGAFACIGPNAVIGEGVHIGAHCVLGQNASVGLGSRLSARVTLGDDCSIGMRCIVHSGVVIGADGFGFAPHAGRWEKIEQLGHVRIGNDVEIGANTCIDRGSLQDTVIEDGVKLDNLIQIGAHCTIGGGAVVLGHLTLTDHVHISAASVVTRSILKPGNYTGFFPIDDNAAWEKNAATLRQLNTLRARIKQLEKSITLKNI